MDVHLKAVFLVIWGELDPTFLISPELIFLDDDQAEVVPLDGHNQPAFAIGIFNACWF